MATVHLMKLAVGVEDVDHLSALQAKRAIDNDAAGLGAYPRHFTRQTPKRAEELLDGGSMYWVIKGQLRVRQNIINIESDRDSEGKRRCTITLDPVLVPIRLTAQRAFQGWRYLHIDKLPPDIGGLEGGDMPEDLARELDGLGLL